MSMHLLGSDNQNKYHHSTVSRGGVTLRQVMCEWYTWMALVKGEIIISNI